MLRQFLGRVSILAMALCGTGCGNQANSPNGNSSGGGGYVTPNARQFLTEVSRGTATLLRQGHPNVFKGLPDGWDAQRLAAIIEKIQFRPNENVQRDGDDLMFNYGQDANGPYITALRPFFQIYADFPVKLIDLSH